MGSVVVAFRGTEDLRNWITNLHAFGRASLKLPSCAPGNDVLVHPGFYYAFQSVREQIYTALDELESVVGNYELFVTGHSLGAALASLCALDLTCSKTRFRN